MLCNGLYEKTISGHFALAYCMPLLYELAISTTYDPYVRKPLLLDWTLLSGIKFSSRTDEPTPLQEVRQNPR